MSKNLYHKVTGDKITAHPAIIWLLSFLSNFEMVRLFDYVYYNYTVEGKRWTNFKKRAAENLWSYFGLINKDETLTKLSLRISQAVEDNEEMERAWWVLFDIFKVEQIAVIYWEFLDGAHPRHYVLFIKACQGILEYVTGTARVNSTGVLETMSSKITMRTIAIQYLAEALSVSKHHGLSEAQVKQRLKEIVED